MENACLKIFDAPTLDGKEILRYAGAGKRTPEVEALLAECLEEIQNGLCYKVVYREYSLKNGMPLGFAECPSTLLSRTLAGCEGMILFAATVGQRVDFLVRRYAVLSPAKAHMLDAIGTERVESLCDAFCAFAAKRAEAVGRQLRPRVSPGYGDLPLTLQKDIFAALDCPKTLGVSLGEGLLMTPRKSVTAIIGIF